MDYEREMQKSFLEVLAQIHTELNTSLLRPDLRVKKIQEVMELVYDIESELKEDIKIEANPEES